MEHRCLLLRIFFERFSSKTLFFTSKNKIAFLRCIFKLGSEPIWDRFGFDFGRRTPTAAKQITACPFSVSHKKGSHTEHTVRPHTEHKSTHIPYSGPHGPEHTRNTNQHTYLFPRCAHTWNTNQHAYFILCPPRCF